MFINYCWHLSILWQLTPLQATSIVKISIAYKLLQIIDSCINCTADVPLPKLFTHKNS